MKKHAWRSPSKGELWTRCSGALAFIAANQDRIAAMGKEVSSEAATQGTFAHEYAEAKILASFHPEESERRRQAEIAIDIKPKLRPEMVTNAEVYATWAQQFLLTAPHNGSWGLELSASLWYEPESVGTADFWAIEDNTTLTVIDYKSGRNEVPVENNIQVSIYLVAVYDLVRRFYPQISRFRAGILQPFIHPEPRFWEFDRGMLDLIRERVGAAAREVEKPFLGHHVLTVSEKGCRYCPAKAICPAQEEMRLALLSEVTHLGIPVVPEALTDEQVVKVFHELPNIRASLDALEDYVRDLPDDRMAAVGLEKRPGTRRYSWRNEEEAATKLHGAGIMPYERRMKSVATIRKGLGTSDLPLLDDLVDCDWTRPKIVRVDDKKKQPVFKHQRKNDE